MQARYEICTEETFNNQDDDDGAEPKNTETAQKEEQKAVKSPVNM